jgi:protein-tyrosine-phosphatase
MKNKINILFVCRYNRFRSRIAEAYFKKINKNKNIKAKSAGLFKGMKLSPGTIKEAKKFGLNINGRVNGLSSSLMKWQNMVVVVANDVPSQVFDKSRRLGKKVIIWKIKDANYKDKKNIDKLIKKIIKRVKNLDMGFLKRTYNGRNKKRGS